MHNTSIIQFQFNFKFNKVKQNLKLFMIHINSHHQKQTKTRTVIWSCIMSSQLKIINYYLLVFIRFINCWALV